MSKRSVFLSALFQGNLPVCGAHPVTDNLLALGSRLVTCIIRKTIFKDVVFMNMFQSHRRPLTDDIEVETVMLDDSGNASHVSAGGKQR